MIKRRLLELPRPKKRSLQLVADCVLLWVAISAALATRLPYPEVVDYARALWWIYAIVPLVCLPALLLFGTYRTVTRYLGSESLSAIIKAITLASLVLAFAAFMYREPPLPVPRSLVFNFWAFSIVLLCGLRLMMREYFAAETWRFLRPIDDEGIKRVAIYGAGTAGNQLANALRQGGDLHPVAFVDDDPGIAGQVISGIKVYSSEGIDSLANRLRVDQILLAMPSVSRGRRREILQSLEKLPVQVRTVPGLSDLASGRVAVNDIQDVDVADLLGRDMVPPQQDLLDHCIVGKVVLVTGAGGSIGSELCRQVLQISPATLILYEHSEYALYSIHQELKQKAIRQGLEVDIVPVMGSVRNLERLLDVMGCWRVDTVYHAAAYKHVNLVEINVAEGILNNIIGTLNTAIVAIRTGVSNFVLISTDKAVRPTNVMGVTKRVAEMILQAFSKEPSLVLDGLNASAHQLNKTRFTMVRFGNVLDSSGSVIQVFRKQIKRGGPVTVTHPKVTRYFMTIQEAAQLVIQAGSMGEGGDVFLLDMGEPVRIVDLARNMIHLSGLTERDQDNPNGDIAITFTGLRPGEKLYEELLIGSNAEPTSHPRIMKANEEYLPWPELNKRLDSLIKALEADAYEDVRRILRNIVGGYSPDADINDLIYQRRKG